MRQLLRNFVALIVGFVGVRLISFVATLYMTNALGPEQFGVMASGLALATFFSVVLNIGLDDYLIREAAHKPQAIATLLNDGFMLKLALLPFAALVILILALFDGSYWWITLWMGLYSILHSFLMLCWSVLRGLELMKTQTSLTLIQMVLIAASTIIATKLTGNIMIIAPLYAGATLAALAAALLVLRRHGLHFQLKWRAAEVKKIWHISLPFGFNYIALLLFDRVTIICITVFIGPFAVGLFSSVYNLTLIATSVPALLVTATLPLLVRTIRDNTGQTALITANLLRYVMILACGGAGAIYILAPLIMTMFAPEYAPAADILRVLAWSLPPLFATTILMNVLETINQTRLCAVILARCVLISVPLSIIATLWGQTLGATLSYVAAHTILTSVLLYTLRKFILIPQLIPTIGVPLLGSSAMVMLATVIGTGYLIPAFVAGSLVFLGVLVAGGMLGKADILAVRSLSYKKHPSTA